MRYSHGGAVGKEAPVVERCGRSHPGSIRSPTAFRTREREFNHGVVSSLEWSSTAHGSILVSRVSGRVWDGPTKS
jgi:hypothetical protein